MHTATIRKVLSRAAVVKDMLVLALLRGTNLALFPVVKVRAFKHIIHTETECVKYSARRQETYDLEKTTCRQYNNTTTQLLLHINECYDH